MSEAEHRLAVYGSLAPGRINHHQLAGLSGRWYSGTVRGTLVAEGWGSALGYPAIMLSASAPAVEVQVFESGDLPDHWARLDAFEGSAYRRVTTLVSAAQGEVEAQIYELAAPPAGD